MSTKRKPYKTYTKEFKLEAIRLMEGTDRGRLLVKEQKQKYFVAIQQGLDRNCAPMEEIFAEIIKRSLASS